MPKSNLPLFQDWILPTSACSITRHLVRGFPNQKNPIFDMFTLQSLDFPLFSCIFHNYIYIYYIQLNSIHIYIYIIYIYTHKYNYSFFIYKYIYIQIDTIQEFYGFPTFQFLKQVELSEGGSAQITASEKQLSKAEVRGRKCSRNG